MNKNLPYWHDALQKHIDYYNEGVIGENEEMSIEFIPKNNKLTVKAYLTIFDELKKVLVNADCKIELLKKCEGGFQIIPDHKKVLIHHEYQIRSNILNAQYIQISDNDKEITPINIHKSNLNVFKFTGYYNIPRKLMMVLHKILYDNNMYITKTYNYPHEDDIIWRPFTFWENLNIHLY
jgi:hypothetical protein